jgi:hypothetical protein
LIDPVSALVLDRWAPLPDRANGSYVTQVSEAADDDQYLARVDHNLTETNKLSL